MIHCKYQRKFQFVCVLKEPSNSNIKLSTCVYLKLSRNTIEKDIFLRFTKSHLIWKQTSCSKYICYKGVITVYFYFSSYGNAYRLRQNTAFQILKHTILKVLTLNLIITCHATRKNFNITLPCIIFHDWLKQFLGNVIIRRFCALLQISLINHYT